MEQEVFEEYINQSYTKLAINILRILHQETYTEHKILKKAHAQIIRQLNYTNMTLDIDYTNTSMEKLQLTINIENNHQHIQQYVYTNTVNYKNDEKYLILADERKQIINNENYYLSNDNIINFKLTCDDFGSIDEYYLQLKIISEDLSAAISLYEHNYGTITKPTIKEALKEKDLELSTYETKYLF